MRSSVQIASARDLEHEFVKMLPHFEVSRLVDFGENNANDMALNRVGKARRTGFCAKEILFE